MDEHDGEIGPEPNRRRSTGQEEPGPDAGGDASDPRYSPGDGSAQGMAVGVPRRCSLTGSSHNSHKAVEETDERY